MRVPTFSDVAWVPYTLNRRTAGLRSAIAVTWIRSQAAGRPCILRVPSHAQDYTRPENPYAAFARHATVVTDRGVTRGGGPTLVPDAHTTKLAAAGMRCASGDSLVLVEHPSLPLAAWASVIGARDLLTDEQTARQLTEEERVSLDSLAWITYNGWTSAPGDGAARRELPRLAASGMTWHTFVGAMLALAPERVADLKQVLRVSPATWREQAASHSADVMARWRDVPR